MSIWCIRKEDKSLMTPVRVGFIYPDGAGYMVSDYVDYDPWVIDPDDMDGWYYE